MIVPTSRFTIKDLPRARWQGLKERWAAVGLAVEWQTEGSLDELEEQLRNSSLVLGSDTGPLHLADYMGVPVIGLYGFTSPTKHGPLGERSQVLYEPLGVDHLSDELIFESVRQTHAVLR